MTEYVKCYFDSCNEEGTEEIKDATQYDGRYNGKKLCLEHFKKREYMKENDVVSEVKDPESISTVETNGCVEK